MFCGALTGNHWRVGVLLGPHALRASRPPPHPLCATPLTLCPPLGALPSLPSLPWIPSLPPGATLHPCCLPLGLPPTHSSPPLPARPGLPHTPAGADAKGPLTEPPLDSQAAGPTPLSLWPPHDTLRAGRSLPLNSRAPLLGASLCAQFFPAQLRAAPVLHGSLHG